MLGNCYIGSHPFKVQFLSPSTEQITKKVVKIKIKMTKKKSEKDKQTKFWIIDGEPTGIENYYFSFQEAKDGAREGNIIHECVILKTFVQSGWEEEK